MTYDDAKKIEIAIRDVCMGKKEITVSLIERLKSLLCKENGDIDPDACQYLNDNTSIKVVNRRINELEHDAFMIGVSYNNVAIEFYRTPCVE
jgi:hypothetical protein|nr:MAG TPA: hypothetical protein [Caudoviricetes sp.]